MIHVEVKNKQYRKYFESEDGFVTGTAFIKKGQVLSGEALMNYLASFDTPENLAHNLPDLNGFYAFAVRQGCCLIAAVDRIRSIPLFYGQKGNDFFISDSAEWVRSQVGDDKIDPLAKEEFLVCGYVTGPDTLFHKVKQIQAGELLEFQSSGNPASVKTHRYYRYVHRYPEQNVPTEKLLQSHEEMMERVIARLIEFSDGRTIAIPLSGGYDSRLIALMLKKRGYSDLIAFSYGRPGNHEAEVSKQVAESLGVRWEFVEYSNELWREWYESPEMKEYFNMAGNLASLPHIQDWPAVWVLQKEGRVPINSIFVPGHSADLPAGSRSKSVPDLYLGKKSTERLIEAIIGYHYNLIDWSKKKRNLLPFFEKKILEVLGDLDKYPDQSSAFESWDISERQPKFIVNSLRVYEFFGYEWWIPFWDKEFMDYWCRISPENRLNQSLYKRYVDDLAKRQGLEIKEKDSIYPFIRGRLVSIAKRLLPKKIRRFLPKKVFEKGIETHPLTMLGRFPKEEALSLLSQGYSSNGISAFYQLQKIEEEFRKGTEKG